jgi:hypothetical protein
MNRQDTLTESSTSWRYAVLLSAVLGTLVFVMTRTPIGQPLSYHDFADKRPLMGIPNFLDVTTNIAYVAVGIVGIKICRECAAPGYRPAWLALFIGVALIGAGSAYYHLDPTNETLVWDRLPMTIGFMGLFTALLADYIDVRIGRYLLLPALLAGAFSVLYWSRYDDLRLYLWVQGMPLLIVPLLVLLFRPKYSQQAKLLVALGFYVLAKIAEMYDQEIYELTWNTISGHSVKHLLSAGGILVIASMLKHRVPVQDGSNQA